MPMMYKPGRVNAYRMSARGRGYNLRWEASAAEFKRRNPWCLGCEARGKFVATEVVDHVEPHRGDQVKFWNTMQWQPACAWCHSTTKRILERMFEEKEIDRSQLWLNSCTAVMLSRRRPRPRPIGADGWYVGE